MFISSMEYILVEFLASITRAYIEIWNISNLITSNLEYRQNVSFWKDFSDV